MRKNYLKTILLATMSVFALSGCYECTESYDQTVYSPEYMSRAELESSVKGSPARMIERPGKIYVKGTLFFIVEENKGIHVIDNDEPRQPINISFIEVPGCTEIQMKNDALLVNSIVDLVTIDISDIKNPQELGRVVELFQYEIPNAEIGTTVYEQPDLSQGYVVDWKKRLVEKTKNCN